MNKENQTSAPLPYFV